VIRLLHHIEVIRVLHHIENFTKNISFFSWVQDKSAKRRRMKRGGEVSASPILYLNPDLLHDINASTWININICLVVQSGASAYPSLYILCWRSFCACYQPNNDKYRVHDILWNLLKWFSNCRYNLVNWNKFSLASGDVKVNWGSGGTASLILDTGFTWKWVISFSLWPLRLPEITTGTPIR
jgi:hypothetical protein